MSWVNVGVTAFNTFSQIQQAGFQEKQTALQASQLEYKAKQERQTAETMASLIRKAGRRQVGQTLTAYAGAGVKVGDGSALEAERQINQNVETDAFQTLLMGERAAAGLELDAKLMKINASLAKKSSYVLAGSNAAQSMMSRGGSGWKTGSQYNYNGDSSGGMFSSSGASILARR